jgi:2-polyprenyl-6-hydroxyphenyl methylase/3-demethylubiquinone-9 3-methyltransferase
MKTSTISKTEVNKFNRLASEWWDPEGSFKPLHKFNPIRIKYIKDNIIRHFRIKSKNLPLQNVDILDIGCGGGLISVPMKKLGANVVGIDASLKNINVAKIYSKKKKSKNRIYLFVSRKIKNKEKI